jgi:uncharacterized membrane protein YgdD (TMEM256/DUF423 family)
MVMVLSFAVWLDAVRLHCRRNAQRGPSGARPSDPAPPTPTPMTSRLALLLAALLLFVAVAAGAFGAHALRSVLAPDLLAVYQTAVQYQFWHGLGVLAIGVLLAQRPGNRALATAAWLLVAGVVLFSGSLYVLALTGIRSLGAITPFGGVALLGGWAALAWAALGSEL